MANGKYICKDQDGNLLVSIDDVDEEVLSRQFIRRYFEVMQPGESRTEEALNHEGTICHGP